MPYATLNSIGNTTGKKEPAESEKKKEPPLRQPIVYKISTEDYRTDLVKNNKVVIIDYYTEWCGPCKQIAPDYEKLASEYAGLCIFAKEDAEKNIEGCPDIRSIPCFCFYVDGKHIKDYNVVDANIEKIKLTLDNILAKNRSPAGKIHNINHAMREVRGQ